MSSQDRTPTSSSQRFGTTWLAPSRYDGTTWLAPQGAASQFVTMAAISLIAVVALLAATAAPAFAGPRHKDETYDPLDTGVVVCDDFTSTTLSDIVEATGADQAHAQGITGSGVDIAVIDTGVMGVMGLEDRLVQGPDLSFDGERENLRHHDMYGHGTHMATVAASDEGMAPGARIVNVKVGAGNGAVDVSQVIAAIDWAVENRDANGMNIRVINLSFGTDATSDYRFDPLSYAVENAWDNGIVVVAAAGNETREEMGLSNPAFNPTVIAVGGAGRSNVTNSGWEATDWTTLGNGARNPDLIAPGECVFAGGVPGSALYDAAPAEARMFTDHTLLRGSGTSQSAAVVAGAAALLLEQRPYLTPDQVKSLLLDNTQEIHPQSKKDRVIAKNNRDQVAGHGLLNVGFAFAASERSAGDAVQYHDPALGTGLLEDARGTQHVADLTGEVTAFGTEWDSAAWIAKVDAGESWSSGTWTGGTWTSGTWSGATWTGGTWSGGTWSGGTWSGGTWSGGTWSGGTWSGGTWSGGTWSGGTWSGGTWSGATWGASGDSVTQSS